MAALHPIGRVGEVGDVVDGSSISNAPASSPARRCTSTAARPQDTDAAELGPRRGGSPPGLTARAVEVLIDRASSPARPSFRPDDAERAATGPICGRARTAGPRVALGARSAAGAVGRHPRRRLSFAVHACDVHRLALDGEAVLRFPFDERLRLLLRAIPGRRWDPEERVWRVPLDPERAQTLTRAVRGRCRHRSRQRRARPGARSAVAPGAAATSAWSTSRAPTRRGGSASPPTTAQDLVAALLEHPAAYRLPAIGRGLLPLDQPAPRSLRSCGIAADAAAAPDRGRAPRAGRDHGGRAPRGARGVARLRRRAASRPARPQLDPDRAPSTRPLARALADAAGSRLLDGPAWVGRAGRASERTRSRSPSSWLSSTRRSVDPRVERWLERADDLARDDRGRRAGEAPVFLLLGDPSASRRPCARRRGRAPRARACR